VSFADPVFAMIPSFMTVFQLRPVPRPRRFSIIAVVSFERPWPLGK
jgi:hypothetical protein